MIVICCFYLCFLFTNITIVHCTDLEKLISVTSKYKKYLKYTLIKDCKAFNKFFISMYSVVTFIDLFLLVPGKGGAPKLFLLMTPK